MKIALILNGNIWFSPYVNIYTKMLDEMNVCYDIISWNRDGKDPQIGIQYCRQIESKARWGKLKPYLDYITFVKHSVKKHKYDKLIVFGPQLAILLLGFLRRYYAGRYVFDYRDLSIEQKPFLKPFIEKVLRNSYANAVSSPGFIGCLPKGYKYLLSHNFNVDAVRKALNDPLPETVATGHINVLTIGGIRDYSSNIEVVKALANKTDFTVRFVGKGDASQKIEDYGKEHNIRNLEFEGFYPKEKEAEYIRNASVMNIFYPTVITHSTALSNRFYNALIHKRPMIVTASSTQGDYVEKYNLGLSLENCENLDTKIKDWYKNNDYQDFCKRCNALLQQFLVDYDAFQSVLKSFAGLNI